MSIISSEDALCPTADEPQQIKYGKLRRDRLCEQVAQELQAAILSGKLKPGDRLPVEAQLANQFGASRTVIREAIKLLSAKGLAVIQYGKGTFVSTPTSDLLSDPMRLLFQMDVNSFHDLHQVRALLETEIAYLAAESVSSEDLMRMRDAMERMDRYIAEPSEYICADLDFHLALATATGNEMFSMLIDSIAGALQDMRRLVFNVPGAPHQGQLEHRAIYEAVAAHSADAAREAMRKHLERAKKDIDTASRQLAAEQQHAS